jgi:putative ABC transport system permease protein
MPSAGSWATVVGIVANARTESLREAAVPEIYASLYQTSTKHAALLLRGQIDRVATAERVREQVQAVDPTLPVFDAQLLDEALSASLAERRFSMTMIAIFGMTALLLTGVGMYGVIAYHVSERTHEIRVRLALGAQGRSIVSMVLREGLAITVTGTIVGLAVALILARAMAGLLYGVRPTDVTTFLAVATILMGVSLCACYLPARRAIRTGALMGLRCE